VNTEEELDGGSTDELLVHALLQDRLSDTSERSAARLTRVREAITPLERRRRWSIFGRRISLAAAASLAILLGILIFLTPDNQALAGVDRILQRLGEVDQTYAIELDEESLEAPRHPGRRRPGQRGRRGRGFGDRYDGAKLYVRGEHYVLLSAKGKGPGFARGYDGHQHWKLGGRRGAGGGRRRGAGGGGAGESAQVEELLLEVTVDLSELLERIRADYEISAPTAVPAEGDDPAMVHYVATPRVPSSDGPSRIQLWADATSGQLDHLVCSELRVHGPRKRYELVVTLLGTDPLPESWFTRSAHEQ